jgi:hypothetical protein
MPLGARPTAPISPLLIDCPNWAPSDCDPDAGLPCNCALDKTGIMIPGYTVFIDINNGVDNVFGIFQN